MLGNVLATFVDGGEHEGLGETDGVGDGNETFVGVAGCNDVFGCEAGHVGCRAVDFGGIFAGEAASTVGNEAAVGVDHDFAASESGVGGEAAESELAGGIGENGEGGIIEISNYWINKVCGECFMDLGLRDGFCMLAADEDGLDFSVRNGDLGFAVG